MSGYVPPSQDVNGWGHYLAAEEARKQAEYDAIARHGAVARSPSTGQLGWRWGATSREEAERSALRTLGSADAVVEAWGFDTHIAVAVGDNGAYWWARDVLAQRAMQTAYDKCAERASNCRIKLILHTKHGDRTEAWEQLQHDQFKFRAGAIVSKGRQYWWNAEQHEWTAIPRPSDGRMTLERSGEGWVLRFDAWSVRTGFVTIRSRTLGWDDLTLSEKASNWRHWLRDRAK